MEICSARPDPFDWFIKSWPRRHVLYSATYESIYGKGSFSFVEPAILSTDTLIPAGSLLTYTDARLSQVEVDPTVPTCMGNTAISFSSCMGVLFGSSGGGFGFYKTPFTSPGTYTNLFATLTITDIPVTVPEPGTLSLLSLGIVGAGSVFRRLRRS